MKLKMKLSKFSVWNLFFLKLIWPKVFFSKMIMKRIKRKRFIYLKFLKLLFPNSL